MRRSGSASRPGAPKKLAVAVTGHGYGHATRTAAVLAEMLELRPTLELTVSTTAPARLFEGAHSHRVAVRDQDYEPGTAQKNCFEVDEAGTRSAYRTYLKEREARLRAEAEHLRAGRFCGLLADVPALAVRAADSIGARAACLWNFTWDWILEPILCDPRLAEPGLASLPAVLRADYALAGLHLKLPFSPRETELPHVENAPLVGRKSTATREETLRRAGLEPDDSRPIVLVAMSGWDCTAWRPIEVSGWKDIRFLVVGEVPMRAGAEVRTLPQALAPGLSFCDLVAACDAVLSKPGYGIVSECIVNRTPLLGVERRGFREAPELVRDASALGPFREISLDDFFAGRWEEPLHAVLAGTHHWKPIDEHAARTVALRLIAYFDL